MKAEDTVMNETLIQAWCLEFVQPGELDLNAKLKEFARAQAEMTFKEGMREVTEFADCFAGIKHNPEWQAQKVKWGVSEKNENQT